MPRMAHQTLRWMRGEQTSTDKCLSNSSSICNSPHLQLSIACDLFVSCRTFLLNRERAVDYLNMLDRLYVFDGYAGWDPEVRLQADITGTKWLVCDVFLLIHPASCWQLMLTHAADTSILS